VRTSVSRLVTVAILALGLTRAALAATPVSLPPGENPANWAEALELAKLAAGPPGNGAWVQIENHGDTWLLRVRDGNGKIEETAVPPPTTQQEREDLLWLARSLLHIPAGQTSWDDVPIPAGQPVVVAAATPPPPPAPVVVAPPPAPPVASATPKTTKKVVKKADTPPAPDPWAASPAGSPPPGDGTVWSGAPPATTTGAGTPASPDGAKVVASAPTTDTGPKTIPNPDKPAPDKPAAAAPPPAEHTATVATAPRGWVVVGPVVGLRADIATVPGLEVAGGVRAGDHVRIGVALDAAPSRALTAVDSDAGMGAVNISAGLSWVFREGVTPVAGVAAGLSVRSYRSEDAPLDSNLIPFAGAQVGVEIPIRGSLGLLPWGGVRVDLRETTFDVGGVDAGVLPAVEGRFGLSLTWAPGKG
jgi:hypothetical protein